MVWAAVAYCLVGSVLAHYIGRPLIKLNFMQQRYEANLRHHLVRVREYSESIALDHGEAVERGQLDGRFTTVLANYLNLIRANKKLIWFQSFFGQAAVIFPFLVAAPRFFSGAIQLGQLIQISSAFGKVQDSLSWFVDNYDALASWRATTDRLTSFEDSMVAQTKDNETLVTTPSTELGSTGLDLAAAYRCRAAGGHVAEGSHRRPHPSQGSVRQRQVHPVSRLRRHLAFCQRQHRETRQRHVHPPAPLFPQWLAARCAGLPGTRHGLQRPGPHAGARRRPCCPTWRCGLTKKMPGARNSQAASSNAWQSRACY
jgi:hypothetical protein